MKQIEIIITDPNGVEFDVTGRIAEISTLQEGTEEDLLEFIHGDIDLELNDRDGEVEKFFRGAGVDDEFIVRIYRETGDRRRKWDVAFGGVLDIPHSLTYHRKDQMVSVQVFSYTKKLERGDADAVKRDIGAVTGTVTADSRIVTVSSTTDLVVGDLISLEDIDNREENTIASVDSSTQITCVDQFTNAYTDDTFTLESPYYRNKSIEFLAGELFDAAGIDDYDISIFERLAEWPVRTAMNVAGMDAPLGAVWSIVEVNGQIAVDVTQNRSTEDSELFVADNPIDGFSSGGAQTERYYDWRPYTNTEPGTILQGPRWDTGQIAPDHGNGIKYQLVMDVVLAGATTLYLIDADVGVGSPVATIDSYSTGGATEGYDMAALEYDPVNDYVWISYQQGNGGTEGLKIYDVSGATLSASLLSTAGSFRCVNRPREKGKEIISWMTFKEYNAPTLRVFSLDESDTTQLGQIASQTVPAGLNIWTLRLYGDYLVGMYSGGSKTRIRVWSTTITKAEQKGIEPFDTVADYVVSNDAAPIGRFAVQVGWLEPPGWTATNLFPDAAAAVIGNYLTVFTLAEDRDILVGCAAGQDFFVLSPYFDGVLDYANFEGLSCAAALRELAATTAAYTTVDRYQTGYLKSRLGTALQQIPEDLTVPLERTSYPVTDWYKDSIKITGEDIDGNKIEEIVGEAGESARRLDVTGSLIQSDSIAAALGTAYYEFLSRAREEEHVEVRENGRLIRPLDHVILDDRTYLVVEVESDIQAERQQLRLIQFIEVE